MRYKVEVRSGNQKNWIVPQVTRCPSSYGSWDNLEATDPEDAVGIYERARVAGGKGDQITGVRITQFDPSSHTFKIVEPIETIEKRWVRDDS